MDSLLAENISRISDWIIEARTYLHSIPELGYEEFKTSTYIAEKLFEIGYDVETGLAVTGVVAVLDTGRDGETVMLRADMDALRMPEETKLPFASTHAGCAHGCGHDAHMAMLLGAAKVLFEVQEQLSGKILFVFQPAEEGLGGAKKMIEDGLFTDNHIDYVFSQHVWPSIPAGHIGIKSGPLMSAFNRFDLEIIGKGGHGAMPHQCIDALEIGTQVVAGLQRLNSRKLNPFEPNVLTVGSFHSGTAFNVIPETAVMTGTTRTFNHEIWKSWETEIETVVSGICSSMGAKYKFEINEGSPPVINDKDAAEIATIAGQKIVESKCVVEPEPSMVSEDVSFYHQEAKGCMMLLGCGGDNVSALHNPKFSFPEELLTQGVSLHCQIIFDILGDD